MPSRHPPCERGDPLRRRACARRRAQRVRGARVLRPGGCGLLPN